MDRCAGCCCSDRPSSSSTSSSTRRSRRSCREYADELELSKAAAGVLSAAYAAGTLVASLPAGFMAARVGPRRTLLCGLLLLGAGEPRVRIRGARRAARRRPLRPGGGGRPGVGWGADLADPGRPGEPARLGDRRRPRHRDRGSAARTWHRSARRGGRHRARLLVGAGVDRGAVARGAAHARAGARRAASPARGGSGDRQPLGAARDLVRGGALCDVRGDRGADPAADRRASVAARAWSPPASWWGPGSRRCSRRWSVASPTASAGFVPTRRGC